MNVTVLSVASFAGMAWAQTEQTRPIAFVTALTGGGATRGASGPAFPSDARFFSEEDAGVRPGDSVLTVDDGTAVVTLPFHGTVVRLEASSELALGPAPGLEEHVPVSLTLLNGRAHMVRRTADERWVILAGVGATGSAYSLSKGASLVVSVDAAGVTFSAVHGEAFCYAGSLPTRTLVDDSGQLTDQTGKLLPQGHSISTEGLEEPVPDEESGRMAVIAMGKVLYNFGLIKGGQWVKRAEAGDFTPVRGAARGAPQFFAAELTAEFAFDQPRSPVVAPAPRTTTQPLRTPQVSQSQALLQSGVPTSVVVGQRLRRSRIIGSPGTAGSWIQVNPSAEQLIRLPGGSR